jgi:hypothetical protein
LADSARRSVNEDPLASPDLRRAVEQLEGRSPAQNERRCFGWIDVGGDQRHVSRFEQSIRGVGTCEGHVVDLIANFELGHAWTDLIDLADDVIPHDEGHLVRGCLRVEVPSNERFCVIDAGGQDAHAHLAATCLWNRRTDHTEVFRSAVIAELYSPIKLLSQFAAFLVFPVSGAEVGRKIRNVA